MALTIPPVSPKRHLFPILAIVLCACAGTVAAIQLSHARLISKNNLFSLVGGLDVTTSQILDNTKGLKTQVNRVEQQLGELKQQSEILARQQQTGTALAYQLSTQISLTQHNVAVMGQILSSEERVSTQAAKVQAQSQQLAGQINTNAGVLTGLANTLGTTNRESSVLNGQMDSLLAELQNSGQEFHLFGQVDSLLGKGGLVGGVTGLAGQTATGLGNTVGTVTKGVLGTGGTGGLLGGLTHSSTPTTNSSSSQTGQSHPSTNSSSNASSSNQTGSGGGLLGLGILG